MARPNVPTIPDEKLHFYREQLLRELTHLFKWEGLPPTIPVDYLERTLIRDGYVLFYEDEDIGKDVIACDIRGYNRHNMPVEAYANMPNTLGQKTHVARNIKRLTDSEVAVEQFDPKKDGVLISNMEHGQSCREIVDHYALRLALAQQAFDTSLIWANIPYIFLTDGKDLTQSINKMFADIFSGKPFIITDKYMFQDNTERSGVPTNITYIGKELMDTQNEIMMKFRQAVGFDTAGVDKAERTNTLEIMSNEQHTTSVVNIMLQQRQIAVENINAFFNLNVSVGLLHDPGEEVEEGGEELGTSDGGTTPPIED